MHMFGTSSLPHNFLAKENREWLRQGSYHYPAVLNWDLFTWSTDTAFKLHIFFISLIDNYTY